MKIDREALRDDLRLYTETALRIGLPCAAPDVSAVDEADEAALVDLAATQGWDLGKYILDSAGAEQK